MARVHRYVLRRRRFLNPISSQANSYIAVLAESSYGGEERTGTYIITLADCRRIIELDFSLYSAQARRDSLRKIDLLLDTLTAFRKALYQESCLIEKKLRER